MLYSVFFYQRSTRTPLWEKSFDLQLTPERMRRFSSFFSAMQGFAKDLILKNQNLSKMDMGNYVLDLIQSPNLDIDIITLSDPKDNKYIKRFQTECVHLFQKYKKEFSKLDGNTQQFQFLDSEIKNFLEKLPELRRPESVLDIHLKLLDNPWRTPDKISPEEHLKLENQRVDLLIDLKMSPSLVKKIDILKILESISKRMQDKEELEKILSEMKKLLKELSSVKENMMVFLARTKKSLQDVLIDVNRKSMDDLDFKDVYLNLFSFATKLKVLGDFELAEEYRKIAGCFLSKPPEFRDHFPKIIKKILNISEDLCDYIPQPYCEANYS